MSIVSGTTGAVLGANAQDDATQANRRNAQETNRLNMRQFRMVRGDKGNAVLPWYLRTESGQPWEGEVLGPALTRMFESTNAMSPEEEMAQYRDELTSFLPMRTAANDVAGSVFDGRLERRFQEAAAPVQAARMEIAPMKKQAALEALEKTLGEIDAAQAARGFSGDGMGKSRLRFEATRDANTAAAEAAVAARLANAEEMQRIAEGVAGYQLQNLNLPYQLARQNVDQFHLPEDAYLDQVARRLQPLTFVRIGEGQPFQYQPMPRVDGSTSTGQLMAQAGAGVGNAALNYYLKQRQAQQVQQAANNTNTATQFVQSGGYGAGVPQNYGTWAPALQADYASQVNWANQFIGPDGVSIYE
jgi:hypothetical protein